MEMSVVSYFALAVQFSLGIVFLTSFLPKIRRPISFVNSVIEYKILPTPVASMLGFVLIPLELLLAIAFLLGWWIDTALAIATFLLSIFLVAVAINLRRGYSIACGCFGNIKELISPRTLARLLLLLGVTRFLVVFRSMSSTSLPSLTLGLISIATLIFLIQTLFLAIFLVLLSAWILNLPELISLGRYLRQSRISMKNEIVRTVEEGL